MKKVKFETIMNQMHVITMAQVSLVKRQLSRQQLYLERVLIVTDVVKEYLIPYIVYIKNIYN